MSSRRKRYSAKDEELRLVVAGYESSGKTRAAYAAAVGLPVATLDYYRRRMQLPERKPKMFEVEQVGPASPSLHLKQSCPMRIEVAHGRAIGFDWFELQHLAGQGSHLQRLIRLVEEA